MRNFNFLSGSEIFRNNCYVISRNSPSFSYFRSEYEDFPLNSNGNLLVPSSVILCEKNSKVKEFLLNIKRKLLDGGESIIVPVNSSAHEFFSTEYRNGYVEDIEHNIIVPKSYTRF